MATFGVALHVLAAAVSQVSKDWYLDAASASAFEDDGGSAIRMLWDIIATTGNRNRTCNYGRTSVSSLVINAKRERERQRESSNESRVSKDISQ